MCRTEDGEREQEEEMQEAKQRRRWILWRKFKKRRLVGNKKTQALRVGEIMKVGREGGIESTAKKFSGGWAAVF